MLELKTINGSRIKVNFWQGVYGCFCVRARSRNNWRTTGDDSAQLAHVNPPGETCNKIRQSIDSSHGTVTAIGYPESKSNGFQKLMTYKKTHIYIYIYIYAARCVGI